MATYTPAALIQVVSLSSTTTASAKYSSPASTTGIIRTININAAAAALTFTLSLGAETAGTRIFSSQALTASVASIFNGWWVTAAGSADAINVIGSVTSTSSHTGQVSGYSYA